MMTAAMTSSSSPAPRLGLPAVLRAASMRPASAAVSALSVKAPTCTASVRTPEYRAAVLSPPAA